MLLTVQQEDPGSSENDSKKSNDVSEDELDMILATMGTTSLKDSELAILQNDASSEEQVEEENASVEGVVSEAIVDPEKVVVPEGITVVEDDILPHEVVTPQEIVVPETVASEAVVPDAVVSDAVVSDAVVSDAVVSDTAVSPASVAQAEASVKPKHEERPRGLARRFVRSIFNKLRKVK